LAVEVHEEEQEGNTRKVGQNPRIKFSTAGNTHHVDYNEGNGRAHVDHELQNLQGGQILLPPRTLTEGIDGEVIIHNNVHCSVVEGGDPTHVDASMNRHPGDGNDDRVVEEMEHSQLFLSQNQEHSVKKFVVLGEVEGHAPLCHADVLDVNKGAAVQLEGTVVSEDVDSLVELSREADQRESTKDKVVDSNCATHALSLDGFAVSHDKPQTTDDSKVQNHRSRDNGKEVLIIRKNQVACILEPVGCFLLHDRA